MAPNAKYGSIVWGSSNVTTSKQTKQGVIKTWTLSIYGLTNDDVDV
jgi:hypothetical protein